MPWDCISELPDYVQSKLSESQQEQWLRVWNATYEKHGEESRAFAYAWGVVNEYDDE